MFAGPNGSGKSTLASFVAPQLLGVSVNADDIEAQVRRDGHFDAASMGIAASADALLAELIGAPILTAEHRRQISGLAQAHDGRIFFPFVIDSYVGSAIAEVMRGHLVKEGISFTFVRDRDVPPEQGGVPPRGAAPRLPHVPLLHRDR